MIAYGPIADGTIADNPASGGAPVNYDITAQHGTFSLTGQSVTISRNRALSPTHGTFSLSGQSITLLRSKLIEASHGTFSLTGQDATLARNRALSPLHGSFALAGQDADITYTPVTAGYELVAQYGVFSVAWQGAELSVVRTPPPIAYWDVMLVGAHTPTKKKQRKQELETMFLLLG
jgi:hypothetical protein